MAVKTYKLRFDFHALEKEKAEDARRYANRAEEVRQWLWDTHLAFNDGVCYLARELLADAARRRRLAREKDGVWHEWQLVCDIKELQHVRNLKAAAPEDISLAENKELLARFQQRGRTEGEAVELSLYCSMIFAAICPPAENDEQGQMPRDDLDLLTAADSRPRAFAHGERRRLEGKRRHLENVRGGCSIRLSRKSAANRLARRIVPSPSRARRIPECRRRTERSESFH